MDVLALHCCGRTRKTGEGLINGELNGFCPQLTHTEAAPFQYFDCCLNGHLWMPTTCLPSLVSTAKYPQVW